MVAWNIDSEGKVREEWVEKWGQEEFDRRKEIAAAKVEEFPKKLWKEQMVFGGQFEPIAMQCSQDVFDQLADKDYKFWMNFISKVIGR